MADTSCVGEGHPWPGVVRRGHGAAQWLSIHTTGAACVIARSGRCFTLTPNLHCDPAMAIRKLRFAPCHFDTATLALDGETLKKHWPQLHGGDQEPFPDPHRAAALIKAVGRAPKGVDAECLSERRSEEHTSELQSLMRISYAVFCLKKK